jgi:hypothetical protein
MIKKLYKWLLSLCLVIGILPLCVGCSTDYDVHGFEKYFHHQANSTILMGNSSVEIDQFGDIYPLYTDYSYIDGDYHYSLEESLPFYNVLERTIVYFEYAESDYQNAKAYCQENLPTLGDTATEEYNGYVFYDIYGDTNNYPRAFQRVVFHEEKHIILFLGLYSTDKRANAVEQDIQDWGSFLQKYFGEYYSFED